MKKENPNVRAHERRHVNHQHSRVFSHFFVAKSRLKRCCSQDGRAHFLVRRNRLQMRAASYRAACVLRTSSTRDDVAGKTESVHLQTKLYASWCKIVKIPHQSTHRKKRCLGLPSNKGCQRLLETLSAPRNPSIVDANRSDGESGIKRPRAQTLQQANLQAVLRELVRGGHERCRVTVIPAHPLPPTRSTNRHITRRPVFMFPADVREHGVLRAAAANGGTIVVLSTRPGRTARSPRSGSDIHLEHRLAAR